MAGTDLVGRQFGRLTVLARGANTKKQTIWIVRCACGKEKQVRGDRLRNGMTKSCGCLQRELMGNRQRTHGMTHTPEFKAYDSAKQRCRGNDPHNIKYYRERGIQFKFKSFEEFLAELGPRPTPQHSVDRFPDNDGHYEPGNVRWATDLEQRHNQRRVK